MFGNRTVKDKETDEELSAPIWPAAETDCTTLESWLRRYDAGNPSTVSAAATPFLTSAFTRPTYIPSLTTTALSSHVGTNGGTNLNPFGSGDEILRNRHDRDSLWSDEAIHKSPLATRESRGRSLLKAYTPPSYQTTRITLTPSQIIGDYHAPIFSTPPIGASLRLPTLATIQPIQVTPHIAPPYNQFPACRVPAASSTAWQVTDTLTKNHLNDITRRICSELNWDFFSDNFDALNIMNDAATEVEWRTHLKPMYERFLDHVAGGNIYEFIDIFERRVIQGVGVTALDFHKAFVSNLMIMFADVRVNFQVAGPDRVWREQDKDTLKAFLISLLDEGKYSINPLTQNKNGVLTLKQEKKMVISRNIPPRALMPQA
jgi:hypothetical protein